MFARSVAINLPEAVQPRWGCKHWRGAFPRRRFAPPGDIQLGPRWGPVRGGACFWTEIMPSRKSPAGALSVAAHAPGQKSCLPADRAAARPNMNNPNRSAATVGVVRPSMDFGPGGAEQAVAKQRTTLLAKIAKEYMQKQIQCVLWTATNVEKKNKVSCRSELP